MRKVVIASTGEKVTSKERRTITDGLYKVSKVKWESIPLREIRQAFADANMILLQEDDTPYSGMFLGEKGRARIAFGRAPEEICERSVYGKLTTDQSNTRFTPISNSLLILEWYKDQGMTKSEINCYIS
jgi:hypothetical protein